MDRNIILNILKEEGYPSYMLDSTVEKLEKLQPEIMSAFLCWLSDRKVPSVTVEGFSFTDLTRDFGMKPIGAFITLDWLMRDPYKAIKALKRGIR